VFREALRRSSWVEGQNLVLDVRYSDRYEQLPTLMAGLLALGPDVIVSLGTPATEAAKSATATIPIVMESLADAVAAGLVPNLARPGGNVTGVSGFAPELSGKRLELIRELLPGATRIAIVTNLANQSTPPVVRAAESAAEHMRMHLRTLDIRRPEDLGTAFDSMTQAHTDAFILAADPMLFTQIRGIVALAERHRLPGVYETGRFAEAGGLLSYGPLTHERFAQLAGYVDRILRGARPGDLPIERAQTFELVLNARTAKALGLKFSPALRLRADRVIE
jgi:putative ABC transport system substrate-binding protein